MIVRLSSVAIRGSLVLFAVLLAVGLSYPAIRTALAQHQVALDTPDGYKRAVRLDQDDARNWYLLGRYWQYNLDSPDTHQAILDYQQSLSLDPHSTDAWLDLATAYELENDLASARNAFSQAKRSYPLSPDVSWRYGNFLLRRGELASAFAQLKQAVQVDPKLAPAAFALSRRVQPDIQIVLNDVLPPSPGALLNVVDALSDQRQTEQALTVWSRLKALAPRFPLRDSYSLIEALLQKLQIADAQSVWNDALGFSGISRPADVAGSVVWDGGFESGVVGGGFTWRLPLPVPGVQISSDSSQKHSGMHSLRFVFNGLRNVDLHDVCQYAPVEPATPYRFSAWVRTDSLSTDQGLRFTLKGVGDSSGAMAWTEDVRGTLPWTQVSLPWLAKTDVRAVQICVARLPSAKFDAKIHGIAWVDDVVLVPQQPETSRR